MSQANPTREGIVHKYHHSLDGLTAVTNHGESVVIVGAASDPQRARVLPRYTDSRHVEDSAAVEFFTPRVANLKFDYVTITRANRLATDAERARAWQHLMQSTADADDAIYRAGVVLCDMVTYRLNHAERIED
jgi:hypothetical protein